MDVLDLLLKSDTTKLPEKEYKHKRLSQLAGEPVIFKLKALPYGRADEITSGEVPEGDLNVHIILAGVIEPDLKNKSLQEKYGAATPAELVKKLLLAGEINAIAREIERLSGFRTEVLEEIKKN